MAGTIEPLLDEVERSYREVQERMSDPAVYNDHREVAEAGRRLKELEEPFKLAEEWRGASAGLAGARAGRDPREVLPRLEPRVRDPRRGLQAALGGPHPAAHPD